MARQPFREAETHPKGGEVEDVIVPLGIEIEQETDHRRIAEVVSLPGVMTYGKTREEAVSKVQALALRVLADRLEHGEFMAH